MPQDRAGRFSTEVFERYQRSEKALVAALVEMYVQGVSTRKVKAISEELCGHEFSASTVSALNEKLDEELERFARQRLEEEYPYVILDARYEKVREDGVVRSRAVLVAIGINQEGRRRVIGVELANRESATSWREFLLGLKRARAARGAGGGQRRPRRAAASDGRSAAGSGVAAVLRALSAQRAGLPAAQRRGRMPDGAAVAVRPAGRGGSAAGSGAWLEKWAANTASSARGWKKTSRRRGRSTGCRGNTTNISRARTCWSGSTRS